MDRISYIPCAIRSHIVSFLPIEDAIRTSVLSRQWRDVCSSLSTLTFNQFDFVTRGKHFKDFVYQTIAVHDGSDVKTFMLTVFDVMDSNVPHLHSWISFAVRHNVEDFSLILFSGGLKLNPLPLRLFTCKTLTQLKLGKLDINVPNVVLFPMLKTLVLGPQVHFYDENQTSRLISSSPVLEYLGFISCSWANSSLLVISAPSLKFLYLNPSPPSQDVRICCSNLRQIMYAGNPPDISLETLSSLSRADFDSYSPALSSNREICDLHNHNASRILMGLQNVVSLSLNCAAMEVFNESSYMLNMEEYWQSNVVSSQSTLNQLRTVRIAGFGGSDYELDLVRYILENANVMEKLIIDFSKIVKKDVARQTSIGKKLQQFKKASPCATISFASQ
ncbi:hypothetical protein AQUCO_02200168v1 [Aquilegia coerulea]|uniref:FBD domain-containing protein n=1 Tax=Aquilegia coerulea TaxID=218851 RepID=A0A2G5DDF8_AQUCA|nr:hypothetical protein AQUCO_02200168v1 [Aquilegia coerulea]